MNDSTAPRASRPRTMRALSFVSVLFLSGCCDGCDFELFHDGCESDDTCVGGEICTAGLFGTHCGSTAVCETDKSCPCESTCKVRDEPTATRKTCENGCGRGLSFFCAPVDSTVDSRGDCTAPGEEITTASASSSDASSSSSSGSSCALYGASCELSEGCCSGYCLYGAVCATPTCGVEASPCQKDADCCANHCIEGLCAAPKCIPGAEPHVMVEESATSLAEDDDALYWVNESGVRRLRKTGGEVTTIALGAFAPPIASNGSEIVWSTKEGGILSFAKGDDAPFLLATGPSFARAVAVSDARVAWVAASQDGKPQVLTTTLAGGEGPTVVSDLASDASAAVAIDAEHAYFADGALLRRVALSTAQLETLVDAAFGSDAVKQIADLSLDGKRLAWSDARGAHGFDTTTGEIIDYVLDVASYAVAAGDGAVAWTRPPPTVVAAEEANGTHNLAKWPFARFPDEPHAVDIVLDEACVYWADPANGVVAKVAR